MHTLGLAASWHPLRVDSRPPFTVPLVHLRQICLSLSDAGVPRDSIILKWLSDLHKTPEVWSVVTFGRSSKMKTTYFVEMLHYLICR